MSDSRTPKTDAETAAAILGNDYTGDRMAAFSRRLETQLEDARRVLQLYCDTFGTVYASAKTALADDEFRPVEDIGT